MSVTDRGKRRVAVTPKPSFVSFDLAHWVKHLEKIHAELSDDGYDGDVYWEFAFDLVRTLGWAKYHELVRALEKFTGDNGLGRAAYFDDDGSCWSHYTWGSHADEEDVLAMYEILGWEQSVLLCHWHCQADEFFDDWNEHPHSRWEYSTGAPGAEVVELPHGPWCPDTPDEPAVTPVTVADILAPVTALGQGCRTCNGPLDRGRSDAAYCSSACRQKAYRARVKSAS